MGSTTYYGTSPSAGQTTAGYIDNNGATPFNFTQATSTLPGSPTPNSTYARFDGLTGGSFSFSITGANGVSYITGFQIVPEPRAVMVLLAGAFALAARRGSRMGSN